MAELFDRDIKTIGKHINNALKEELMGTPVVANFATTASDGKVYQVEHYNIEMITSVGYRVKSQRGTQFRTTYENAMSAIVELRGKFGGSPLFGNEKDQSFKGSIGAIY